MRKLFLSAAIAACSAVGLHASDVAAQEAGGNVQMERIEATQVGQQRIYAVNFLCGQIGADADDLLVPGTYLTAINIANLGDADVNLRVRARESWVAAEGIGTAATLDPALPVRGERALQIDCLDIFDALANAREPENQFFQGFLFITPPEGAILEVIAIYTYSEATGITNFGGGAGGGTPQ